MAVQPEIDPRKVTPEMWKARRGKNIAIALAVADGTNHPEIAARAPYQLVVANILAGPLIEMAGGIAPLVAAGGRLLLAGLLQEQAAAVTAAYTANGLRLVARHDAGDWPTLMLTRDEAR